MKTKQVWKAEDVPEDWDKCCLKLWEEDDAPVPDKEKTSAAFKRITQINSDIRELVHTEDLGDSYVNFYRGGWVRAFSPDGGWVGVLVERAE